MKKFSVFFLTMLFCLTSVIPVFANQTTAVEKINEVENILYGTEQKGSLLERVDNLEEDINGNSTADALLTRIDRMYYYVKGSYDSSVPSFLTKLNTIEWTFAEKLGEGPAKSRLEDVESLILGRSDTGSLDDRLDVLLTMAFDNGDIEVQRAVLPQDTLIKISTAQDLDSRTSREGEKVLFRAEDNIFIGDLLVIPKGAVGHGYIAKVSRAKNFGRNAKIEIEYTGISAIDSTSVPITVGELAKEATTSLAKAAGASVAGMVILGPVGIIGGAFIKGKEYHIPAGAVLYVQIEADTVVNGVYLPDASMNAHKDSPDNSYGGL